MINTCPHPSERPTNVIIGLIRYNYINLCVFLGSKEPTGPLNRDSLINYINEEGIKAPEKEDAVPFEVIIIVTSCDQEWPFPQAGIKRGKVFVPKYDEDELQAMKKKEEIAEATK